MDETAVDLIEVDVGGGFGARGEFYPGRLLDSVAARQLRGRVRWIEDRREHLLAMNHAREMYADMEIACRRDGTVIGIRGRIDIDLGAYVRTNGFTTPRNVVQFVSGPYAIPNIDIDAFVFVTNKTPTGTYRGPGRYEFSFFCERLFDMAANDLGIDPDEFRRRNLIREEQLPRPLATILNVDASWQTELDNGDYASVMERCLDEFGWSKKRKIAGPDDRRPVSWHRGRQFRRRRRRRTIRNARMTIDADGGDYRIGRLRRPGPGAENGPEPDRRRCAGAAD